mmetsp:Transcript_14238/g.21062  ORF Transcript_14238/g.21062 Transcript_14238/m.21062 type:complete len:437 (-) Transcript_14238:72-1382(-)
MLSFRYVIFVVWLNLLRLNFLSAANHLRRGLGDEKAPEVINERLEHCTNNGMNWSTENGNIMLNGAPFRLKGANWFGFETPMSVLHGLWIGGTTINNILDFCRAYKINALRIPISLTLALNVDTMIEDGDCVECLSPFSYDAISMLMKKAAKRGILILFDMHNLTTENKNELWYDENFTEEDFIQGWSNIIGTFGSMPNFMGIDIMNEPHGAVTWGMGLDTDWDVASARIAKTLKLMHPSYDRLILVEGIHSGGAPSPYPETDSAYEKFWGSNLDGLYTTLVDVGEELDHLLVYSSHIYGPSLYPHKAFSDPTFPDNMPAIWDKQINFVEGMVNKPVIVGEWGGVNEGDDALLQAVWSAYMAKNCLNDGFYWAINPNSSDLEGLLDDTWFIPNLGKMELMETTQPFPSYFTKPITMNTVCLIHGAYPEGSVCEATG